MIFFLIPLFAFLNRCRGGFLGTGHTQWARLLFWVFPVTVWAAFHNPFLAPACGVLAFLGLLIPHARYQADASLKSVLGMAAIGLLRLALILTPLAYYNVALAFLAPIGLLQGAAYYLGWKYLDGKDSHIKTSGFTVFGLTIQAGNFAVTGSEWGEVLTGAVFGLAFALAGCV